MKPTKRRKKKNLLLRVLCIIVVCYFSVNLIDNYNTILAKRRELALLKEGCEEQELANQELERLLSMSDSKEYIERIARDKLGFVYPDEKIFIDVSGK